MTDLTSAGGKAPWHLWLVGGLSLLWNLLGCYLCFMSWTGGEAYYRASGVSEAQVAYLAASPAWSFLAWALGVGAAAVGSVLLLMRRKWAFHAFAVSLLGLVGTLAYTHLLSKGGEIMGAQGLTTNAVISAISLFLLWYAWVMTRRGVLR